MKTTLARAAVLLGALLAAGAARAQDYRSYRPQQSLYIFNYEISKGVGSFGDFIDATSYRGFSFEARSMVRDSFSAGIGVTWNRFDQTVDATRTYPNGGQLTGPSYRYADQLAIKGLFHAYLGQGALRPYLGVGLGGVWNYSYSQMADFASADNGFEFIASPEVGLTFTLAKGASSAGINLALRYNWTTADFQSVNDAQSVALAIGFFGSY
ncbi:MAG: hypothetical protein QM767_18410 [Anaeromyxobacter sp.]